jgi:hypothetical protein
MVPWSTRKTQHKDVAGVLCWMYTNAASWVLTLLGALRTCSSSGPRWVILQVTWAGWLLQTSWPELQGETCLLACVV